MVTSQKAHNERGGLEQYFAGSRLVREVRAARNVYGDWVLVVETVVAVPPHIPLPREWYGVPVIYEVAARPAFLQAAE